MVKLSGFPVHDYGVLVVNTHRGCLLAIFSGGGLLLGVTEWFSSTCLWRLDLILTPIEVVYLHEWTSWHCDSGYFPDFPIFPPIHISPGGHRGTVAQLIYPISHIYPISPLPSGGHHDNV